MTWPFSEERGEDPRPLRAVAGAPGPVIWLTGAPHYSALYNWSGNRNLHLRRVLTGLGVAPACLATELSVRLLRPI